MPSEHDQNDLKRWANAQLAGWDEEYPEDAEVDQEHADVIRGAAEQIAEIAEEVAGQVDDAHVEKLREIAASLEELAGEEEAEDSGDEDQED